MPSRLKKDKVKKKVRTDLRLSKPNSLAQRCKHPNELNHILFVTKTIFVTNILFILGSIQVLRHQRGGWVGSENGNA